MAGKKRRRIVVDADAFTERLNRLFAVVYPPGRGPYRNVEVTEALAGSGHQLSAPYLSQLRSGIRSGPSARTVEMLAEFFGVQVEYFDTDSSYARAVDADLDWLEVVHDQSVRELTTALMMLAPTVRDRLIDSALRATSPDSTAVDCPTNTRAGS
ncbi:helix-turn-helix domain-containing protein [Mycolicibacterium phocaicum]|uniref:helix-turn-helix domain-containing protein n=1 Tax=Mycolicibacterium phocaicum TaxID=319706 RepID=UPI001CFB50C3|nr:helix-turn-helix transcriptional regulator [Mycolicibacterium phocaicum]UCZ58778.1 XRE family transcriptional regulator [Mycolicibacterium phocaicum]